MSYTISCVIPHFNEGTRLDTVLQEIGHITTLCDIICVDDESVVDRTAELQKKFPRVTFLRHSHNTGKTGAIRTGARQSRGEYILLLDADLRNLDHTEIQAAITAIQQTEVDMLILRRVCAPWIIRAVRGDVLVTGERIIRTDDLENILKQDIQKYQLESAINEYMYTQNKRVFWFPFSAINTHKPLKMNIFKAVHRDILTFKDMFSGAGFFNFFKHMCFFGKKEIPAIKK